MDEWTVYISNKKQLLISSSGEMGDFLLISKNTFLIYLFGVYFLMKSIYEGMYRVLKIGKELNTQGGSSIP